MVPRHDRRPPVCLGGEGVADERERPGDPPGHDPGPLARSAHPEDDERQAGRQGVAVHLSPYRRPGGRPGDPLRRRRVQHVKVVAPDDRDQQRRRGQGGRGEQEAVALQRRPRVPHGGASELHHEERREDEKGARVGEEREAQQQAGQGVAHPVPLREKDVREQREVEERLGEVAGVQQGRVEGRGARGSPGDPVEEEAQGDEARDRAEAPDHERGEQDRAEHVQVRARPRVDRGHGGAGELREPGHEPGHQRGVPDPLAEVVGVAQQVAVREGLGLGALPEEVRVVRPVEGPRPPDAEEQGRGAQDRDRDPERGGRSRRHRRGRGARQGLAVGPSSSASMRTKVRGSRTTERGSRSRGIAKDWRRSARSIRSTRGPPSSPTSIATSIGMR